MARFQFPGRSAGGITWPTVEEAANKLEARYDSNQDGSITVDEIVDTLDPQGRAGDGLAQLVLRVVGWMDEDEDETISATELTSAMDQLDRNDDGVLSPADLRIVLDRDGAGQVQMLTLLLPTVTPAPRVPVAPTVDQVVQALLTRFDTDDTEAITLSELQAVLNPQGQRDRLDDALAALVTALDADGNGVMSVAELTSSVSGLDTDGNGVIDRNDRVPGPPVDDAVDLVGVLLPKLREFDVAVLEQFG